MKAAVCYEFGQPLVIEELELAPPKANEIKVKITACAICHSDIIYMEGKWGGRLPALYGHEAAGIVDEVGEGVDHLKAGDRVIVTLIRSCGTCFYCAQGEPQLCESSFALDREDRIHNQKGEAVLQAMRTGAFAEYVVVHESQIVPVDENIPLESASLLACGVITGLGAVVNTVGIPAGSSVAVIGCGGVGLNSVQGAAISGAHRIIAVDLVDSKLEAADEFGATHGVNPTKEDAVAKVKSLTEGRGCDYVFVAVGSVKAFEQGIEMLRPGGTLAMVGMPGSGDIAAVEIVNIAAAEQKIVGCKMGSTRLQVDIPRLVDLYHQKRLKLDELITGRYPLEQINEAIDAVRNGEALRNVIIFD